MRAAIGSQWKLMNRGMTYVLFNLWKTLIFQPQMQIYTMYFNFSVINTSIFATFTVRLNIVHTVCISQQMIMMMRMKVKVFLQ